MLLLNRKFNTASDPTSNMNSLQNHSSTSLLPADNGECDLTNKGVGGPLRMALMTRGKGNRTVLKAVKMESDQNMHESWRHYNEQREKERREMKHVTLAMNERIQHQQQAELMQEINQTLNGLRVTSNPVEE